MMRIVFFLVALLMNSTPVKAADELGRLFFDAKQRAGLDEKRKLQKTKGFHASSVSPEGEQSQSTGEMESVVIPEPRVTGKVTRSSGNNTVWINHHPNYKPRVGP